MLHINEVEWCGDHRLRLAFDNGVEKIVDVSPLLTGPMFEPLHDTVQFRQVALDPVARTVVWANGADLAPEAVFALEGVDAVERR